VIAEGETLSVDLSGLYLRPGSAMKLYSIRLNPLWLEAVGSVPQQAEGEPSDKRRVIFLKKLGLSFVCQLGRLDSQRCVVTQSKRCPGATCLKYRNTD
jgi:hypothetical protein